MQQSASTPIANYSIQPKPRDKETPQQQATAALNHSITSLPAPTSSAKPPTLLALDPEIQLQIFSHLSNDPTADSPEPTLLILRRTHSTLRKLIPIHPITPTALDQRRAKAFQLHRTETRMPYLFPESYYPCYKCVRVLHIGAFVFSEAGMVGRNKDIGGPRAHLRQCADCSGIYRGGFPRNFMV